MAAGVAQCLLRQVSSHSRPASCKLKWNRVEGQRSPSEPKHFSASLAVCLPTTPGPNLSSPRLPLPPDHLFPLLSSQLTLCPFARTRPQYVFFLLHPSRHYHTRYLCGVHAQHQLSLPPLTIPTNARCAHLCLFPQASLLAVPVASFPTLFYTLRSALSDTQPAVWPNPLQLLRSPYPLAS